MLCITYDQLTSVKEEKEHTKKLEQGITMVYDRILDNMQAPDRSENENIKIIAQSIGIYRKEIKDFKQKINPMNPHEV
jgi:hypothetical protein